MRPLGRRHMGLTPYRSPCPLLLAQCRSAAGASGKLAQSFLEALLQDAGQLARKAQDELTPEDVRAAVALHDKLPFESSPAVSAIAQQLIRVLLSYQGWLVPTGWRNDARGGPEKWYASLPAPEGDGQLLPLASDMDALSKLKFRGAPGAGVEPLVVKGFEAVSQYLNGGSSSGGDLRGLALNPGAEGELVLGEQHLPLLRRWAATLQLEALLKELFEQVEGGEKLSPATLDMGDSLRGAPLAVVRNMDNSNLALDKSGRNYILLTSPDAAALCAQSFGADKVRSAQPDEILTMARQAEGEFGFALCFGPNVVAGNADPGWQSVSTTAEWLAAALAPQ